MSYFTVKHDGQSGQVVICQVYVLEVAVLVYNLRLRCSNL